jgi:hypothetical protein
VKFSLDACGRLSHPRLAKKSSDEHQESKPALVEGVDISTAQSNNGRFTTPSRVMVGRDEEKCSLPVDKQCSEWKQSNSHWCVQIATGLSLRKPHPLEVGHTRRYPTTDLPCCVVGSSLSADLEFLAVMEPDVAV